MSGGVIRLDGQQRFEWKCPLCMMLVDFTFDLIRNGDSPAALIHTHLEGHGLNATAIRAELDRIIKAITL